METDDGPILDAVIGVVSRYGIKRATMDELASHSGVSRQTLYDRYGGKDGVIAAAITMAKGRIEDALRVQFGLTESLDEKIEAYFSIAIWPVFEPMRAMPDSADLERGLGAQSKAAGDAATTRRQGIIADMLAAYALKNGQTPQQIAVFFEQSCDRAMMSSKSPEELASYLSVLKAALRALVEHHGR